MKFFISATCLLWVSCANHFDKDRIPGPAAHVKRSDAIAIAYTYANLAWTPQSHNALHGKDSQGILVHSADKGLATYGFSNGWWIAGKQHNGMPYQWGGFDTPRTFLQKINRGHAAGDISTATKRAGGDAAVSHHAAGIDCSGLVSRCWRLPRPFSTAELPGITDEITWGLLLPGDILLNDRHVLLFAGWQTPGSMILAYEAGPFPSWKVSANAIPTELLIAQHYQPRRYRRIITDTP